MLKNRTVIAIISRINNIPCIISFIGSSVNIFIVILLDIFE
jgi:hypothetical protein